MFSSSYPSSDFIVVHFFAAGIKMEKVKWHGLVALKKRSWLSQFRGIEGAFAAFLNCQISVLHCEAIFGNRKFDVPFNHQFFPLIFASLFFNLLVIGNSIADKNFSVIRPIIISLLFIISTYRNKSILFFYHFVLSHWLLFISYQLSSIKFFSSSKNRN